MSLSTNSSKIRKEQETESFYITTAISYTNGSPHIGHGYEAVTADIIARYQRLCGKDVFFLTGTDEHGQKIATTASKHKVTPKQLCNKYASEFKKLNEIFNVSYDRFIRTTDEDHYDLVSKIFQKVYENKNGDIYLSKYCGWYNIKEEKFIKKSDAKKHNFVDPTDPNNKYIKHEEDAYFFRLSKYQNILIDHIERNKSFIVPETYYNEILTGKSGLKNIKLDDLCISRSTIKWGIPVPINKNHVIYVWFDALSNYLTGINYNLQSEDNKYWPCNTHIIGKDIIWFHAVIWPSILFSCNIPLPKQIVCHGFVTDENGEKFSKSKGNGVNPFKILQKYNSDALRYFFVSQTKYGEDLKWNIKNLINRNTKHLAHIIGNLINRVFAVKLHNDTNGIIPNIESYLIIKLESHHKDVTLKEFNLDKLRNGLKVCFDNFDLLNASKIILEHFRFCNAWFTEKEPWNNNKNDKKEKSKIIRTILELIYILSHCIQPFLPKTSNEIFNKLNHSKTLLYELNNFNNLTTGKTLDIGEIKLFKQHHTKFEKKQHQQYQKLIKIIGYLFLFLILIVLIKLEYGFLCFCVFVLLNTDYHNNIVFNTLLALSLANVSFVQ